MSLLAPPDPEWAPRARGEIDRLLARITGLATAHHIGSTSVPGLPAKPIIDLLAVFETDQHRHDAEQTFVTFGYEWLGAYGLPGRSYARKSHPETGIRQVQAHCYTKGHPDITRHLAFRDALRNNASLRAAYTSVKAACAARHPAGGEPYQACKSDWIEKAEKRAMDRLI